MYKSGDGLVQFITESHFLLGFSHIFCCVMELRQLLRYSMQKYKHCLCPKHPPTMKAYVMSASIKNLHFHKMTHQFVSMRVKVEVTLDLFAPITSYYPAV